jgi:MFS family permease
MKKQVEDEGLEVLEKIEAEVRQIEKHTPSPKRAFYMGIMQGMGVVVGSLLAVILLGWLLHIFGLIPGLKDVTEYLQDASSRIR